MPIKTPKELCVSLLSELRHGAERSRKIYAELGEASQNPEIKEALDASVSLVSNHEQTGRMFSDSLVRNRLRSSTVA